MPKKKTDDNSLAAWSGIIAEQGKQKSVKQDPFLAGIQNRDSVAEAAKISASMERMAKRGRPRGIPLPEPTPRQLIQNHVRDVMLLCNQHDIPLTQAAVLALLRAKFGVQHSAEDLLHAYLELVADEYILVGQRANGLNLVQWCMK